MTYASKIFTLQPNTTTVPISLPAPYDEMDIKDIELFMVKSGSNDAICKGFADSAGGQVSEYAVSNSTGRKSGYSIAKSIYIQELNGSSWEDKVVGTADLSTPGEIWFTFTTFDANYYIIGIARGEVA